MNDPEFRGGWLCRVASLPGMLGQRAKKPGLARTGRPADCQRGCMLQRAAALISAASSWVNIGGQEATDPLWDFAPLQALVFDFQSSPDSAEILALRATWAGEVRGPARGRASAAWRAAGAQQVQLPVTECGDPSGPLPAKHGRVNRRARAEHHIMKEETAWVSPPQAIGELDHLGTFALCVLVCGQINGLYKSEMISHQETWEAAELATLDGRPVSTITDCSNPSAVSRLQKLRQTSTNILPIRPPQGQPDLSHIASTKPGADQAGVN